MAPVWYKMVKVVMKGFDESRQHLLPDPLPDPDFSSMPSSSAARPFIHPRGRALPRWTCF